jgi:hypothetical protein
VDPSANTPHGNIAHYYFERAQHALEAGRVADSIELLVQARSVNRSFEPARALLYRILKEKWAVGGRFKGLLGWYSRQSIYLQLGVALYLVAAFFMLHFVRGLVASYPHAKYVVLGLLAPAFMLGIGIMLDELQLNLRIYFSRFRRSALSGDQRLGLAWFCLSFSASLFYGLEWFVTSNDFSLLAWLAPGILALVLSDISDPGTGKLFRGKTYAAAVATILIFVGLVVLHDAPASKFGGISLLLALGIAGTTALSSHGDAVDSVFKSADTSK